MALFTLSACRNKSNCTSSINNTTANTAPNIEGLQDELSELKDKYNESIKIYEDNLEYAINTYCKNYLSYIGSATDNIEKIKDIVTDDYYSELQSQIGHKKSEDDYEQFTGIEKLYYSNYSSPSESTDILVQCKQTVIFDDEVDTYDVYYVFGMTYEKGIWKVNSVSNNS